MEDMVNVVQWRGNVHVRFYLIKGTWITQIDKFEVDASERFSFVKVAKSECMPKGRIT